MGREERDSRKAVQGKLREEEGEGECERAGLPEAGGSEGGRERERWGVRRCWDGRKEGGSERGGGASTGKKKGTRESDIVG